MSDSTFLYRKLILFWFIKYLRGCCGSVSITIETGTIGKWNIQELILDIIVQYELTI